MFCVFRCLNRENYERINVLIGNDYKFFWVFSEKEMGKIMHQLEAYKAKRDSKSLTKEDSIRIDYLFNQYQTLKNGH